MKLSKSEEELIQHIWAHPDASLKELQSAYPDPTPATTTIATMLKRMIDKGFVKYKTEGKTRLYQATVKKEAYFSSHLKHLIGKFFNNSAAQFASFFTEETDLSKEQLEELRGIIDQQIEKKS